MNLDGYAYDKLVSIAASPVSALIDDNVIQGEINIPAMLLTEVVEDDVVVEIKRGKDLVGWLYEEKNYFVFVKLDGEVYIARLYDLKKHVESEVTKRGKKFSNAALVNPYELNSFEGRITTMVPIEDFKKLSKKL